MLVKNWMTAPAITLEQSDSMEKAIKLLKQHNVRMLPVMVKEKLCGIITDRDIKRASASDATTLDIHELLFLLSKIKIKDIMTKNPIVIPYNHTIEEAAALLLENRISGAPVIGPDNKIAGIITQTDIFRALITLTGFRNKGIMLAVEVEDKPGSIKEVADIIRKYKGRISSILSSAENAPKGLKKVYIRTHCLSRKTFPEVRKEINKIATLMYMVDHREDIREIY
ncbi:MAG: CBS and ACT domain-containing protein [Desulfobacterales bacterium]|nr:CBS and ACT domain-containing protein [Desulfobacterales bacterium]